jgi:hypothetical protein
LRSLLAATADDPLNVICLFSSVAARTGNAGQADYAMANEVLNRVAHELAHTRPGCVVKSIGWGPWAGGMVTPVLKAKFDEMGVPLIPLENGARRFVDELQQADRSEVETVIGGAPQQAPLINPQQAAGVRAADYDVVISAPPILICAATKSTAWWSCRWCWCRSGSCARPMPGRGATLQRAAQTARAQGHPAAGVWRAPHAAAHPSLSRTPVIPPR